MAETLENFVEFVFCSDDYYQQLKKDGKINKNSLYLTDKVLTDEIKSLQTSVETLTNSLNDAKNEITNMKNDISALNNSLDDHNTRITYLEEQNDSLTARINEQQDEIDALKQSTATDIANLTKEIDTLKETVGNISNTVDKINGEVI